MKDIKVIISFLIVSVTCWGQTRVETDVRMDKRVGYELGAGGSQYSQRKPDKNGLLTSQYTGEHHLIGFYTDGAYSMQFNNCANVKNLPGGGGTTIGGVYEYQNFLFRLQTGIGFRFQSVENNVDSLCFTDNSVYDAYHYPYQLHYEFIDRKDQSQNVYVQVPLLLGANFQGVYFFIGTKVELQLWGRTTVKAIGSTTGTYNQFIGIYEEMDNHGFRKNVELVRYGQRLSMRPNFHITGEVGYEWGEVFRGERGYNTPKEKDYRIKIALFADICINNVNRSRELPSLYIPADYKWDFPAFELYHVFSSNEAVNSFVRNMYAGVKFTFLIGFHSKEKCIICGPYRSERAYQ